MDNPFIGSVWEPRKKERERLQNERHPAGRIIYAVSGCACLAMVLGAASLYLTRGLDIAYVLPGAVTGVLVSLGCFDAAFMLRHRFMLWRFDRAARKARQP